MARRKGEHGAASLELPGNSADHSHALIGLLWKVQQVAADVLKGYQKGPVKRDHAQIRTPERREERQGVGEAWMIGKRQEVPGWQLIRSENAHVPHKKSCREAGRFRQTALAGIHIEINHLPGESSRRAKEQSARHAGEAAMTLHAKRAYEIIQIDLGQCVKAIQQLVVFQGEFER
jgi:hypothetical protein